MGLNYRKALRISSFVYILLSISLLVPAFVSIIYSEYINAVILTIAALLLFAVNFFINRKTSNAHGELTMRCGMLIVAFTWLLFPIYIALVFYVSGAIPKFTDCIFESFSGVTTTGASVINNIEEMPRGIIFLRSMLQWLGGLGFLTTSIVLIPMLYRNRDGIFLGYDVSLRGNKSFSLKTILTRIAAMYLVTSAVVFTLLRIGKLSFYDSVVHTFGCVSTGGFSCYQDNIAHFHSDYIYTVFFFFMFICSMSYMLMILVPTHGPGSIFKDSQLRLFVTIFAIATILIGLNLMIDKDYTFLEAFKYSGFESMSIMSTSGYNVTDFNTWPQFSKSVIFLLLFVGGCAGSTAGGIKIFRIGFLLKLIKRSISVRLHPNAVIEIYSRHRIVKGDILSNITNFFFLYILLIFAGTLAISVDNFDIATNMSASASCLGNIGPGFNLVAPFSNYGLFSGWSKMVLSFLMLSGRLELFWILGLFSWHFWDPNRS